MKRTRKIYNRIILIGIILGALSMTINTFAFEITNMRTTTPSHSAYLGIPLYFGSNPKYTFTTFKGTLKANLEQIAYSHNWSIEWCSKKFYYVVTEDKISGTSFENLTEKLISHYPLKTTYDTNKRILTISDLPPQRTLPVK